MRRKGFTLTELAVVLAVLTVILGAIFVTLMQRRDVQATEVLTIFQDLARGVAMYYSNTGTRPTDLQILQDRGYITGYTFRDRNTIAYKDLNFRYDNTTTCMIRASIQNQKLREELNRRLSDFRGWVWYGNTLAYCFPF